MYSTLEAARRVGVCKNTLLRWINEGLMPDVGRDWRLWRVWTEEDVKRAVAFKRSYHSRPMPRVRRRPLPRARYAKSSSESMSRYATGLNAAAKRQS